MVRYLFSFVSTVSFVLCLASSLLWARSHLVHERYIWRTDSDLRGLINCNGTFQFQRASGLKVNWATGYERLGRSVGFWEMTSSHRAKRRIEFLGAGWYRGRVWFQAQGSHPPPSFWFYYEVYVVSYWPVALSSSLFPLLWVARFWRRRSRRKHGLCLHCGYNLRASTVRCPECGTPVPELPQELDGTRRIQTASSNRW
jgi:4-amino-4-deoxy-L-arabinose transferase-like glycosyltransferase